MARFYQVGGCVRDEIMGRESNDIDYSVEAESFDAMRSAIVKRGGTIFLESPEYFTIRAHVPSLGCCDYVLCRKDGEYSDGRRPDSVEMGTILDDLARRDFTMNAIAKGEDGTFIDPFDGITDIENRMIRCVGSTLNRFHEDSLRMLRAIRFRVTMGFRLHDDIVETLHYVEYVRRLSNISDERIREELRKAFRHDTIETLNVLSSFPLVIHLVFGDNLWLEPTLKSRN